jgi:lysophospholipase L1-like esterase
MIENILRPAAPSPLKLRLGLRLALTAYIVLLHLVLLVLVFKTDFLLLAGKTLGLIPPEEWNQELVSRILEQAEADRSVPPGSVILIGDSMIARLDAREVAADAVNFGIGGDTTRTLYARLPTIRSLDMSRAAIIEVGANDLKYRPLDRIAEDYGRVLAMLPSAIPILAVSVLPVDEAGSAPRRRSYLRNDRIAELNLKLKHSCEARARCQFLDASPSMTEAGIYGGDGWHLSSAGSLVLAHLMRNALTASK